MNEGVVECEWTTSPGGGIEHELYIPDVRGLTPALALSLAPARVRHLCDTSTIPPSAKMETNEMK